MRRCRGTTLVEVTAAVAALAVAVLASAVATMEGAALAETNAMTRAATRVLATLHEEARTTPFDRLDATYAGVTRVVPIRGSQSGGVVTFELADAGGTVRWPVRRLTARVAWTTAQGPREVATSVLLCDRPGTAGGGAR